MDKSMWQNIILKSLDEIQGFTRTTQELGDYDYFEKDDVMGFEGKFDRYEKWRI
jgi:hypothetical protein